MCAQKGTCTPFSSVCEAGSNGLLTSTGFTWPLILLNPCLFFPDAGGSPVCDRCLPKYTGPQCDQCSAGFYKQSGLCVPCDCSGNADLQGPTQICHPETGHCLRCINNTTGPRCQLCAAGYIGDALAHNCTRPSKALTRY